MWMNPECIIQSEVSQKEKNKYWILIHIYAMTPHSSTLAWKIPWTEEPGRLQSMGSLRVGYHWATSLSCVGEGKGNPLQCSCLENPRDRGTWWAAVSGVAQSQTRLKWLSSSNAYICNLERWYWWTWFQARNTDTDIENGCVDTWGEGIGESTDLYIPPCVK